MQMDAERKLTEQEAAQIVGVSVHCLRAWRWRKKGPKYFKLGSCVRYTLRDLNAYLESHLVDPEAKPTVQPGHRRARKAA
jgi:predicted DNA-binding transcriptional regulator AlpA